LELSKPENQGLEKTAWFANPKRMSNFWTVQFLKTESEPNIGFLHDNDEHDDDDDDDDDDYSAADADVTMVTACCTV